MCSMYTLTTHIRICACVCMAECLIKIFRHAELRGSLVREVDRKVPCSSPRSSVSQEFSAGQGPGALEIRLVLGERIGTETPGAVSLLRDTAPVEEGP